MPTARSKRDEARYSQKFEDLWNRLVAGIIEDCSLDREFCVEQFMRVAIHCRDREVQSTDMGQKHRYGASALSCERFARPTPETIEYLRRTAEQSWEYAKKAYGPGYLWIIGQMRLCLLLGGLTLEDVYLEESAIANHYREYSPNELEGVTI